MPRDRTFATAVHVLTTLAYMRDDWVNSQMLATGIQTNAGLVRRILCKLSDAGFIETKAGPSGGARLRVPPEKISLADVYESVSGEPVLPVSDRETFEKCPISCNISSVLTSVFEDAEGAMRSELAKSSIQDVLKKIPKR